ncbi:HD-GYP domain-containing protein [Candidatus Nitrospira nitrificans]|uniref:Putative Phosphohydrolase n=1 Tax=Candidatus Nitrospira nitrificans TaxID=1742973 RepID=A0A0S4LPZ7_9BACT|nr:HD-GYP domain-containing protein [Candidatus Nitrospira nitrificans]CUS38022.1 putative Phosphohydrolase [Candidatus Nitrospira nitrificans]
MTKRIGIDELQPGMLVEQLDRSWLSTPFFRHKMTITSPQQIAQLKACGVRTLVVRIDAEAVREAPAPEQSLADDSNVPVVEESVSAPPVVPFEEELAVARQVYQAAKTVIQEAMHDARLGRALNVEAVRAVVTDMTDSVFRNPDALSSLSRLKRFDEYTFYHSVNTALLAMSLGKSLGFDRSMLHLAGVGTLLHDIGKTKVPLAILNKPGRFEAHEMEIMKQHVLRGVEVLAGTTDLGDSYVQPALEHHERVNGAGYPHRRARKDISQFGLITAIVDIYDAMTSDRCYHKGQPAHQALQLLYRLSLEGHLDPALVQQFIQVVGVYPVGSVVELTTGETGIVKQINHEAPLAPVVLLVKSAGNTLLSSPREQDLSGQTETPRRSITTVLSPQQAGLDPTLYLDKKAA